MITPDNKLVILENFRVDQDLPKFHLEVVGSSGDSMGSAQIFTRNVAFTRDGELLVVEGATVDPSTKGWWGRLWRATSKPTEFRSTMSVQQFFRSVHNTAQELTEVESRAKGYEEALRKARVGGQKALIEQLSDGLETCRQEAQLVASGHTRYIDESDIVRFYKECPKGLRLDWVANFVRQIPDEVLDKKKHLDELGVFDNYAVLHYDPKGKSYAETEAEKAARKDPILFGLLKGKRRLYFVGDWVDEVCDLTLDQIAELLGKDVVKEHQG